MIYHLIFIFIYGKILPRKNVNINSIIVNRVSPSLISKISTQISTQTSKYMYRIYLRSSYHYCMVYYYAAVFLSKIILKIIILREDIYSCISYPECPISCINCPRNDPLSSMLCSPCNDPLSPILCSPCNVFKPMVIFCNGIANEAAVIEAKSSDTVRNVRQKLKDYYSHKGILINDFQLRYGTKVLKDSNSLEYYNIQNEATLFCFIPILGGMEEQLSSHQRDETELPIFRMDSNTYNTSKVDRTKRKRKKKTGRGTIVLNEMKSKKLKQEAKEQNKIGVSKETSDTQIEALVAKHIRACSRDHKSTFVEKGCFMDIFRIVYDIYYTTFLYIIINYN